MTPTVFINGKDESRCYVNSPFQVHFSISFSDTQVWKLILKNCKRAGQEWILIQQLFTENYDIASHLTYFCEMVIVGRNVLH